MVFHVMHPNTACGCKVSRNFVGLLNAVYTFRTEYKSVSKMESSLHVVTFDQQFYLVKVSNTDYASLVHYSTLDKVGLLYKRVMEQLDLYHSPIWCHK